MCGMKDGFNKELRVQFTPDATTHEIEITDDILLLDVSGDFVNRGTKMSSRRMVSCMIKFNILLNSPELTTLLMVKGMSI